MTRTLCVVVRGSVQGVGYRAFVVSRAEVLGLAGWVRNVPGGGVELEAQGDDAELERLVSALEKGPSLADVRQVEVNYIDRPAYDGFDIRW